MTRQEELDLYFAVCACRNYMRRGADPSTAAALASRGRNVTAVEVERLATDANTACRAARRAALARQRPTGGVHPITTEEWSDCACLRVSRGARPDDLT